MADFESLEEDEEDDGDDDGEGRKGKRRRGRKGKRGTKGPTTKRVPRPKGDKLERFRGIRGKDKHPATKTPLINDIVTHILAVSQQPEAGASGKEDGRDKKENVAEAANTASTAVPTKANRKGEWVGKASQVTKQRNYYDAVLVDKVPINVGDYVRLAYGENETTRIGQVSADSLLTGVCVCVCASLPGPPMKPFADRAQSRCLRTSRS